MAEVLEFAELSQGDGPTQVNNGLGGIESNLEPQGATGAEAVREFLMGDDLGYGAGGDTAQRLVIGDAGAA